MQVELGKSSPTPSDGRGSSGTCKTTFRAVGDGREAQKKKGGQCTWLRKTTYGGLEKKRKKNDPFMTDSQQQPRQNAQREEDRQSVGGTRKNKTRKGEGVIYYTRGGSNHCHSARDLVTATAVGKISLHTA